MHHTLIPFGIVKHPLEYRLGVLRVSGIGVSHPTDPSFAALAYEGAHLAVRRTDDQAHLPIHRQQRLIHRLLFPEPIITHVIAPRGSPHVHVSKAYANATAT